jgi:hypothetical protein
LRSSESLTRFRVQDGNPAGKAKGASADEVIGAATVAEVKSDAKQNALPVSFKFVRRILRFSPADTSAQWQSIASFDDGNRIPSSTFNESG